MRKRMIVGVIIAITIVGLIIFNQNINQPVTPLEAQVEHEYNTNKQEPEIKDEVKNVKTIYQPKEIKSVSKPEAHESEPENKPVEECMYPERDRNPDGSCDNTDPCDPTTIKLNGGLCESKL